VRPRDRLSSIAHPDRSDHHILLTCIVEVSGRSGRLANKDSTCACAEGIFYSGDREEGVNQGLLFLLAAAVYSFTLTSLSCFFFPFSNYNQN
jgi:hypothetical protein